MDEMMDGGKKVSWMDPFNVESCCQKDSLEVVTDVADSSWVLTFIKAPESFTIGMGFIPMRCRVCGRHWFKVGQETRRKGYWTVR